MVDSEKEQGQINALKQLFEYLSDAETKDGVFSELATGKLPETENPLLRDAANQSLIFDGGRQAARAGIDHNLNLLSAIYRHTGNPLFAMYGAKVCLDADLTPPAWIKEYMQKSITRLLGYAHRDTQGRPDDPLVDSFGFRKGGGSGGGTWFRDFQEKLKQLADLLSLMQYRLEQRVSWEQAHASIAADDGFRSCSPKDPDSPPSIETFLRWRDALLEAL